MYKNRLLYLQPLFRYPLRCVSLGYFTITKDYVCNLFVDGITLHSRSFMRGTIFPWFLFVFNSLTIPLSSVVLRVYHEMTHIAAQVEDVLFPLIWR